VFLDLRIVKELRSDFSEVRILKGLRSERDFEGIFRRRSTANQAFELLFEITRSRLACWLLFVKDHFGTRPKAGGVRDR
jgi:hypothetical protein